MGTQGCRGGWISLKPLIIKGYSDLLLDSATAATRPQIEEIKKAGDRASGLTRQLLAFSRKQILEPQVFDLNQTVRNMVKMLRVLMGAGVPLHQGAEVRDW